ncbi:MAG: 50S ribosomal protein L25/general stress protein Ctc [Cytophagales bacterium]|nr:50S ribosomal protein L25/general stress protein Ctc [Cytophagales bacterium]
MKFIAYERAKQGTGASRRLRITGRTPAIVYGGETSPLQIELDHNDLWHALKKEAFHASILDMELNGKTSKVLLRNVQMHPFRQLVLHLDFQRVEAATKLKMKVPLHFSGQETSPAFKIDNCLVTHVITDLEITCSPADLPEFIAVDLSQLKKGVSLHASDLTMPKGVKVVKHGTNDPVVVSVVAQAVEEAPAADAAAAPAADAKAGAKKAPAKK